MQYWFIMGSYLNIQRTFKIRCFFGIPSWYQKWKSIMEGPNWSVFRTPFEHSHLGWDTDWNWSLSLLAFRKNSVLGKQPIGFLTSQNYHCFSKSQVPILDGFCISFNAYHFFMRKQFMRVGCSAHVGRFSPTLVSTREQLLDKHQFSVMMEWGRAYACQELYH